MGESGQGQKTLSPKTQKNDDDNEIRKIISPSSLGRPPQMSSKNTADCSSYLKAPSHTLGDPPART